jgi:hypothetical protein
LVLSSKNSKKNIDSDCFDILALKNDVNVPSKSNKQKTLLTSSRSLTKIAGCGSASGFISQRYGSGDPDSDPYQTFMDPKHGW